MTVEQRIALFKELRAEVVNDKAPSNGTVLYVMDLFEHMLELLEHISSTNGELLYHKQAERQQ